MTTYGFISEIGPMGDAARARLQEAVRSGSAVLVKGDGSRRHLKVRYDQREGQYTVRVGKRGANVERLIYFERTTVGGAEVWVFTYPSPIY